MSTADDLRRRVGLPALAVRKATATKKQTRRGPSPEAIEQARAAQAERRQREEDVIKTNLEIQRAERDRARAETAAWRAIAAGEETLTVLVDESTFKAAHEPEPEEEDNPKVDEREVQKTEQAARKAEFEERIAKRTTEHESLKIQKALGFDSGLARRIADAQWYVYAERDSGEVIISPRGDAEMLSDSVLDEIEKSWTIAAGSNAGYVYLRRPTE